LGRRKLKVGLVTIGQSPRTDVTPTMKKMLGPEVKLIEKGALDGLTREEIHKFAPTPGDYILVTRIRDGTSVRVAKRRILPRVQKCIEELEEMGVDLTLLLCTGEFPEIKTKKLLIKPDKLISNIVWGILKRGKLGVVVPEKEQIPLLRRKWKKKGVSLVMATANPYGEIEASEEAATFLAEENVDLIILDCIGFTPKVKGLFRRLTGKPVILPQTILGRILKELVSV
jgi:protein AroM